MATENRTRGFTLVELLVVISIIALLITILTPTIGSVIKQVQDARVRARVAELGAGCEMFAKGEGNGYFPGQEAPGQLAGGGGSFTGSQWLGRILFTDTTKNPAVYPASRYAPVRPNDDLMDPTQGGYKTISDVTNDPRAILYYPARLGETALDQYKYGDNSLYCDAGTEGASAFSTAIKDTRLGVANTPYNPQGFLIIAAGIDRTYFTKDDPVYPAGAGK